MKVDTSRFDLQQKIVAKYGIDILRLETARLCGNCKNKNFGCQSSDPRATNCVHLLLPITSSGDCCIYFVGKAGEVCLA